MEPVTANQIDGEELAANKIFTKKLGLLSFDADAVYASKDWPYLWRKTGAARSRETSIVTGEELARRKALSRRILKISGWGAVSLLMYLATFLNQAAITRYFTRGGFFALAVVGTALVFALVHGTFAGHVLENLNFKAANRPRDGH